MNPTLSDSYTRQHPPSPRVTSGCPPAVRERRRLFLQLVECDSAIRVLDPRADVIATALRDLDDTDPRFGKLALLLGVTIHALEDHRRLADEVRAELLEKEAGPAISEEARRA